MKRDLEKHRNWLRRSKPLRSVSRKRAAVNRERANVVRAIRRENCEARHAPEPCFGHLTIHEVLPRARGGSITDPSNLRTICARHNDWLSNSVEGQRWGYEHGMLKHSWEAK